MFNQKYYLIVPIRLISFAFVLIWILRFFSTYACKIILYTKRDNVTSSFPVWISFIFSCLIAWVRTSSMLNRSGKSDTFLPYSWSYMKNFHFSLLSILVPVGFSMWPLVCWDNVYLFLVCGVVLLWKDVGFCLLSLLYQLIWSCEFCPSFCYCGIYMDLFAYI